MGSIRGAVSSSSPSSPSSPLSLSLPFSPPSSPSSLSPPPPSSPPPSSPPTSPTTAEISLASPLASSPLSPPPLASSPPLTSPPLTSPSLASPPLTSPPLASPPLASPLLSPPLTDTVTTGMAAGDASSGCTDSVRERINHAPATKANMSSAVSRPRQGAVKPADASFRTTTTAGSPSDKAPGSLDCAWPMSSAMRAAASWGGYRRAKRATVAAGTRSTSREMASSTAALRRSGVYRRPDGGSTSRLKALPSSR